MKHQRLGQNIVKVNTIYPTIQGEGRLAGVPMVLIRLQGCSVGCTFCDTKETWDPVTWDDMSPEDLAATILKDYPRFEWIMLTGGEPLEQEIAPLVRALQGKGFRVCLETSGTVLGDLDRITVDWVSVSPKFHKELDHRVLGLADEIKTVIGRQQDIDDMKDLIGELGVDTTGVIISLQPMSQGKKAIRICVEAVLANPEWRLSLQMHKYIELA